MLVSHDFRLISKVRGGALSEAELFLLGVDTSDSIVRSIHPHSERGNKVT